MEDKIVISLSGGQRELLLKNETIRKHIALYKSAKYHSYEEEIRDRLIFMDKDYAKKRIKLLHIQGRLKHVIKLEEK